MQQIMHISYPFTVNGLGVIFPKNSKITFSSPLLDLPTEELTEDPPPH